MFENIFLCEPTVFSGCLLLCQWQCLVISLKRRELNRFFLKNFLVIKGIFQADLPN